MSDVFSACYNLDQLKYYKNNFPQTYLFYEELSSTFQNFLYARLKCSRVKSAHGLHLRLHHLSKVNIGIHLR